MTGDDDFRFATQAMQIDCYASSIGLGNRNSSNVTTSESPVIFLKPNGVEDIMQQVSMLVISVDIVGSGNEKVPIREESLKSPTPML